MSKILVGPLLGVESDSLYTVCFLLDAGDAPSVEIAGQPAELATRVADTPSGQIWRAELNIDAPEQGGSRQYSIHVAGTRVPDQWGRDRWTFHLPAQNEEIRIAYASCNGFSSKPKSGDHYALWTRMREQHKERPFSLLIMGGDQL